MGSLPPSTPHIPGNVLVTQGEISAHSSGQAPRIPQEKKNKKKPYSNGPQNHVSLPSAGSPRLASSLRSFRMGGTHRDQVWTGVGW